MSEMNQAKVSADLPTFDPGKPILIAGTGVMGSLVAWATARAGIFVHAFDAQPGKAQAALE